MQNPGWRAGVSRDQLGGWSHSFPTVEDWQVQMLGCRFCLSPWMARDVARLCFGEGGND
jgi:hypothetical protein